MSLEHGLMATIDYMRKELAVGIGVGAAPELGAEELQPLEVPRRAA